MKGRLAGGTLTILAGMIAAVVMGPLLLRGDPAVNQKRRANEERIAGMTESERVRLKRNYDRYLSLSPEERQRWRDFQARLQADRERDQGRLSRAMESYTNWLESLPGGRRDELRQTGHIEEKLALVRRFVQEQRRDRLAGEVEWRDLPGGLQVPVLGPEEFGAVVEQVESRLPARQVELLVDDQGNPLQGLARHVKLLTLMREQFTNEPGRQLAMAETIVSALPDPIQERLRDERGQPIIRLLQLSLRMSLAAEVERFQRSTQPTPANLLSFYLKELDDHQQEALIQLSASDFRVEVSRLFAERRLEEELGVGVSLRQALQSLEPMGDSLPMRRGDHPPEGRRPPGDRPRPRPRADGERPPRNGPDDRPLLRGDPGRD